MLVQRSTNRIIAGNHRSRVARRRGETTIPVIWLDVDDDQARRILLVDNRTGDLAGYDDAELARILGELAGTDAGFAGSGFDETDLARLLDRWGGRGDPDAVPPAPTRPRSKRGDLWILGRHRLLCGDATDAGDVGRLLEGITPRLMVTDPPYLVAYTGENHPQATRNRAMVGSWDAPDPELFAKYLARALEHLAPNAPVYQWHASRTATAVEEAWQANGLLWHQTITWVKSRPVLTRSDFMWQQEPCAYGWRSGHRPRYERRPPPNTPNVWTADNQAANAEHPTIKPLKLYTDPFTWHLRAGEWAYEPFSGSGTAIAAAELVTGAGPPPDDDEVALEPATTGAGTAIAAAEATGRRCAALELEPAYVDVAVVRWQTITGRAAVHAETGESFDERAASG